MPSNGPARRLFVAIGVPLEVRRAVTAAVSHLAPELRESGPAAHGGHQHSVGPRATAEVPAAPADERGSPARAGPRSGGLRWLRQDAWHLTLTFLGAVEVRLSVDLEARLGRAAGRAAPMSLRLTGAGRFGRHVLWAGIEGEREQLRRLAAATDAAARRAGIDVDVRPYRPHLTLARSDGWTDLHPIVAALAGLQSPSWTADDLLLIQSHLGQGPRRTARHEVVAAWPLGRPPIEPR